MTEIPFSVQELQSALPEYESLSFIAEGGFKLVYSGFIGGKKEAIKVLVKPLSEEYLEDSFLRLEREIGILNQCKSRAIVALGQMSPVVKVIKELKYFTYSEEFLEGDSLASILEAGLPLPSEKDCIQLLSVLLDAIEELDSLNVVHRDIKPLNIIKTNNSERPYVLLDLGIALALDMPSLTTVSAESGPNTPPYLAPEMAKCRYLSELDSSCDLYLAALTVFEYATNVHAVLDGTERTMDDFKKSALEKNAKILKDFRPDFRPEFCILIDDLLKKKSVLRPILEIAKERLIELS